MPAKPAVLFVCLGNICRSPLAEAAFRAAADAAGLAATIDSAGTGDWHAGQPPDRRAIATARAHGIDIAGYRARQVCRDDFIRFTHVLAADHDNLAALARIAPLGDGAALSLMLDLVPGRHGEALADPYWGGSEDFAKTWSDVSAVAAALTTLLSAHC